MIWQWTKICHQWCWNYTNQTMKHVFFITIKSKILAPFYTSLNTYISIAMLKCLANTMLFDTILPFRSISRTSRTIYVFIPSIVHRQFVFNLLILLIRLQLKKKWYWIIILTAFFLFILLIDADHETIMLMFHHISYKDGLTCVCINHEHHHHHHYHYDCIRYVIFWNKSPSMHIFCN